MQLTSENKPVGRMTPTLVAVPSLGIELLCKPLSAGEQYRLSEQFPLNEEGKSTKHVEHNATVIAKVVVNPDGTPVFTVDELAEKFDGSFFVAMTDAVGSFLKGPDQSKK